MRAAAERDELDARLRERLAFADDVRFGLAATPKALPCRWFYDAAGSLLFERICALPEYYLTRAERSIFEESSPTIADMFPRGVDVVELGSGSAEKTSLLLAALVARHGPMTYVPVDVSREALEASCARLAGELPGLVISPVAGDYSEGVRRLTRMRERPKLVAWLGSSIGNLDRAAAREMLATLAARCGPADRLLVGFDRRKDPGELIPAYDDAQGVTAAFNLNLLARINRELGGRFDLAAFAHGATWNGASGCVDMHLVSRRAQIVPIEALDLRVTFDPGESIHTESCHKYSDHDVVSLAAESGLAVERRFLDGDARFLLALLKPTSVVLRSAGAGPEASSAPC